MKTLAAALLVLLLAAPQPPTSVVRIRLFAAEQPSEIRIAEGGGLARQVRVDNGTLVFDGRLVKGPVRTQQPVTIQPRGGLLVRFNYPLEISVRNGQLMIVATLPREEYVAGVLAGEASVFGSEEALKAMAVSARTYAVHFAGRHSAEGFDFCDTTHCQDFHAAAISTRMRRAAASTRGELVWYSGSPIAAYYHQDCGGVTEGQSAYLAQIQDSFCISGGRFQWSASVSKLELQNVLGLPNINNVTVTARTPSGRASRLRIEGGQSRVLDAQALRLAVGRSLGWDRVRSDLYDVRRAGDQFVFEGYGAGHGIGLCQQGAAVMGEMGRSYRQILAYYYPNTAVGLTAQGLSWTKSSSERADLETTRPSQDQHLLGAVERLMGGLETSAGRRFEARPMVRIYPSVAVFRDSTGEPGWVAASTRAGVIRLQPAETLQSRGVLESTLRHELAHVLIEGGRIRPDVPLWFREGIVLWLTEPRTARPMRDVDIAGLQQRLDHPGSEAGLRQAYRDAQDVVEGLVQQNGRETVLGWIERGLPVRLPLRLHISP